MSEQAASFCWIRVLPSTDVTNTFLMDLDAAYMWNLGPNMAGARPPMVAIRGGAGGYWAVNARFAGDARATTVFDLGPAYSTESEAVTWIESTEGRQWAREASNYFLLNNWPESAFTKLPNKEVNAQTAPGKFPDADWLHSYRRAHEGRLDVELFGPDQFRIAPYPTAQAVLQAECEALKKLAEPSVRTPARLQEIAKQAQSVLHAIQPVFDVVGINLNQPPAAEAARAVNIVQANINRVVFQFKTDLNRARPWNTCDVASVKPLWKKGDRLYPGHSSYPSGHATSAYTWAHYLAAKLPHPAPDLLAAAKRVSDNREVAGVHFASDSAAGEQLGEQIARRLLNDALPPGLGLEKLLDLARLAKSS